MAFMLVLELENMGPEQENSDCFQGSDIILIAGNFPPALSGLFGFIKHVYKV